MILIWSLELDGRSYFLAFHLFDLREMSSSSIPSGYKKQTLHASGTEGSQYIKSKVLKNWAEKNLAVVGSQWRFDVAEYALIKSLEADCI